MAAVVHFQHDFQQVAAVQTQDRTPVRANVADLFQFSLQNCGRLDRRRKDNVVNFARAVIFLIYVADLAADQEPYCPPTGWGHLVGDGGCVLRLELKQTILCRRQLCLQLCQPTRMGDIARCYHLYAFELRPFPQVLKGQVLARGP